MRICLQGNLCTPGSSYMDFDDLFPRDEVLARVTIPHDEAVVSVLCPAKLFEWTSMWLSLCPLPLSFLVSRGGAVPKNHYVSGYLIDCCSCFFVNSL